jgi:RNA polymerase sigma factor (sigma-70 family)
MPEPSEFESLMERVRAGCHDAAREMYELYAEPVRKVVRRALHQRLRSQYDSLDFTQSVWASFFLEPADRYAFNSPEELVSFLSRLAYNKVVDKARQRQGTGPSRSLQERGGRRKDELGAELPVRAPTPSQEAMAAERWESLLQGQPPEHQRALELLRQGHTQREVAAVLGLHPKLLYRILQQLRLKVPPP